MDWKNDENLEDDLINRYCYQGLTRKELLSYIERDYPQYHWSFDTLKRRLSHFGITKIDRRITIQEVVDAVEEELAGPGQLLGYRAMHLKLKSTRGLNVPRDLLYAVMTDLAWDLMQERIPLFKRKKKKGVFRSVGPNWCFSLDGHDKLMGFENSTFPLAVYGCLDSCSRKVMFLKIWYSNNRPLDVGRWYFDHLYKTKCMPRYLRVDKGTETGIMTPLHSMLCRMQDDVQNDDEAFDRVLFGSSTSNKIERWWRDCHERLEKYYKSDLLYLRDHYLYNPKTIDRDILAYVLIPIVQRELDIFKDSVWNNHRIRKQKDVDLPCGIPNHIYDFPGDYDLDDLGYHVTDEQLQRVSAPSEVLLADNDYLDPTFRRQCEVYLPDPLVLKNDEWVRAYFKLKTDLNM